VPVFPGFSWSVNIGNILYQEATVDAVITIRQPTTPSDAAASYNMIQGLGKAGGSGGSTDPLNLGQKLHYGAYVGQVSK